MKYCTRCTYPANHPLNLTFDAQGVCSGCRVHEEKDALNWPERYKKLEELVGTYKNTTGSNYDCVVPVSGARDSYFIVHTVLKLGLRPLLVTYNKHYNTEAGIRNLAYLRTLMGVDLMTQTVDPATVKKITRTTLKKNASMYWHCIAGQTVFPVQVAVRFKIPLIIWGAHQGVDQVGMFSHIDEVEMTRKYRKDHDLMGYEAEDLVGVDGLTERDLELFKYPHDKEIEKVGVRGIYLNNYMRWDTKAQHEAMIKEYGYESLEQTRTFDTYNDVDCFHYSDIHDYIKFLKWGYGKASDHATREIRLKRLTREEGIELVQKYEHKEPKTLSMFLEWLGMSREEFDGLLGKYRGVHDSVVAHVGDDGVDAMRLEKKEGCEFVITPSRSSTPDKNTYTLIGKGYVN